MPGAIGVVRGIWVRAGRVGGGWMDVPEWWDWEIAPTDHLEIRMGERAFSEVELRTMLEDVYDIERVRRDRWVAYTRHAGRRWEVLLEPDPADEVILVITAYERSRRR